MTDVIYEHKETGERVNCFYVFDVNFFKIPKWLYSRKDYLCAGYYSRDSEYKSSDCYVKIRFKPSEDNIFPEFYYISSGMCLVMFSDGHLTIQSYQSFVKKYAPTLDTPFTRNKSKKDKDNKPNLAVLYDELSSYIKSEYENKNIKTPIDLYFFKVMSEYYLGKNNN